MRKKRKNECAKGVKNEDRAYVSGQEEERKKVHDIVCYEQLHGKVALAVSGA